MEINKELVDRILAEAMASERKRMNYDLRDSEEDGSQRMLNAMLPGTEVQIHRHRLTFETVVLLMGRLDEIMYDDNGKETGRMHLCTADGCYGCQVPKGTWHRVEVFEPSVILEAKNGRYGEDGSEVWK